MTDITPLPTFTNAATFANADTVAVEVDVHGDPGSCVNFQTAGKNGQWSAEACLRQGFYTIRRHCEYIRFRVQTNGTSALPPILNVAMLSAADLPEAADVGALR